MPSGFSISPQDPVQFAQGWLQNEKTVNGRPVDLIFLKGGSMVVSDDYTGVVYRITYKAH